MIPRGLTCPKCKGHRFRVRHTRPMPDGKIKRYRICQDCRHVLTTIETSGVSSRGSGT